MTTTSPNATGERVAGPDRAPAGVPQHIWDQLPDWVKFRLGADQAPVPPELLDVEGVAALLGCSTRHVYRMSDAGRMPAPVKLGALVRWSRNAVQGWIDAGCPRVRRTTGGAA